MRKPPRQLSRQDDWIATLDQGLKTLAGVAPMSRPLPVPATPPDDLDEPAQRLAGALMRVNHVGEVCAQALYHAQSLSTRDPGLKAHFEHAAREELDHLAWTSRRLKELGSRPSLLNPLWWGGAFAIGQLAGLAGDRISLGFVVETEHQVEAHLASHLERLPEGDTASRAIVTQMQADEVRHAAEAQDLGAAALPAPVRGLMKLAARVMTGTAHYL